MKENTREGFPMLEVLFSDSAAGSMKVGMCRGSEIAAAVSASSPPMKRGVPFPRKRQPGCSGKRRRRSGAAGPKLCQWRAPRGYSAFSPLAERGAHRRGGHRAAAGRDPHAGCFPSIPRDSRPPPRFWPTPRRRLDTLLTRAPREPVRLWVDHTPDAACGLRWCWRSCSPWALKSST